MKLSFAYFDLTSEAIASRIKDIIAEFPMDLRCGIHEAEAYDLMETFGRERLLPLGGELSELKDSLWSDSPPHAIVVNVLPPDDAALGGCPRINISSFLSHDL